MALLDIFRSDLRDKYKELKSFNSNLRSELSEIKSTLNSRVKTENQKALSNYYGIDPKKLPEYRPTFAQKLFYNSVNLSYSFKRIVRDYDDMMADPICGGAVELMTDDACIPNQSNNAIYWPEANNKSNTKKLEDLFEKLSINSKIWEWQFRTCLYGEKIFGIEYEDNTKFTKGIKRINSDIDLMSRIQPLEIKGELIGYLDAGELHYPWKYISFKMNSLPTVMRSVKANRVSNFTLYNDKDKAEDHKNTYIPGTSVLESSRRHWRMLRLMEDSLVIARLERAPVRRVYFVDSGNEDPKDSMELMQLYQSLIQDSTSFTTGSGLNTDFDRINYGSDIFIPVKNGSNSINANDYTKEVDMGRIIDIKYFKDKLFASLKVPQAYLGFDEGRGGQIGQNTLLRQDIRYTRTVKKIKMSAVSFLKELSMLHLLSLGESISVNDILIHSTEVSTAEAEERNNALEKASRVVQTIWQTYDRAQFDDPKQGIDKKYLLEYLTKNILIMPNFDVDKFFKNLEEEGKSTKKKAEIISILPPHLRRFKEIIRDKTKNSLKLEKYTPITPFTLDELYVLITDKSQHNFDINFGDYGFYILKDKNSISRNESFQKKTLNKDLFEKYVTAKRFLLFKKDSIIDFDTLSTAYSKKESIVVYEDDTDDVLIKDRASATAFLVELLKYTYESRESKQARS